MIYTGDSTISDMVIHHVGSKFSSDSNILSSNVCDFNSEDMHEIIMLHLLKGLKGDFFYSFNSENSVSRACSSFFSSEASFIDTSVELASRLHDVSADPSFVSSEVYISHITGVVVDDEMVDAIGIFKADKKETFLKLTKSNNAFGVEQEQGFSLSKIERGCVIFNTDTDAGYKIALVGKDDLWWVESFLDVSVRSNNFYKTIGMARLCKSFGDNVLSSDNSVSAVDRSVYLTDSAQFFKENLTFDVGSFEKKVLFDNQQVVEAFREFKREYDDDISSLDSFEIDSKAVKPAIKEFKKVINLDKNFSITVKQNANLMENGYDENRRMKFIKLFYEMEA